MRTLKLLLLIVYLGCSQSDKRGNPNKQIIPIETNVDSAFTLISTNNPTIQLSKTEKEIVERIKEFKPDNLIPFRELRKITNYSFGDPCKMILMEITTIDLTDTIVHLIDKCEGNVLGILATKYQYPDGSSYSESRITSDTITTITVDSYLGEYNKDYYEVLTDSVIIKKILLKHTFLEFYKDSIRTSEKVILKK